jgi:hypothetical protein
MSISMFGVRLDTADSKLALLHRRLLASLPEHFTETNQEGADAVVIDAGDPTWTSNARDALAHGGKALLVARSHMAKPADAAELAIVASAAGATVWTDMSFPVDATWTGAQEEILGSITDALAVDSTLIAAPGEMSAGLVQHLAFLYPLRHLLQDLRPVNLTPQLHSFVGLSGTTAVSLNIICSDLAASSVTLDVITIDRRWELRLIGDALAEPTVVTIQSHVGSSTYPRRYEASARQIWLHIHADLSKGTASVGSLVQLADCLTLAEKLTGLAGAG